MFWCCAFLHENGSYPIALIDKISGEQRTSAEQRFALSEPRSPPGRALFSCIVTAAVLHNLAAVLHNIELH